MDFLSIFAVLDPKGAIGLAERGLMLHATLFMLIVAVPVFFLTFFFAWYYRAGNKKAKYTPNWEHSKMEELIWWAIPLEIVLVLGALTWTSTHNLDPRKALDGEPPLVVQVVALDWKWLFIYPEEKIATVNYVRMPVDKPVRFELTADAPMNSFWIPELGGQIYAMTGMVNQLHLVANETGEFKGVSANYSGDGFAKMKFIAEATSQEDFDTWVQSVQEFPTSLDHHSYPELAAPSTEESPLFYGRVEENLFSTIVMQFMDVHTGTTKLPSGAAGHSEDVSGAGLPLQHGH